MSDKTQTVRGFDLYEFIDRYGAKYSVQKSSLAFEDCIWFGVNDPDPKILASKVGKINPETGEMTGWVKYDIPDDVSINTRMHLTQDMVRELLPILQKFVDTGDI